MTTAQLQTALTGFVQKYSGQYVDHDRKYGPQCWDVAARYGKELFGCDPFPTKPNYQPGGAVDCYRYFADPLPRFFERHSWGSVTPQRGDVIIWNATANNEDGHIAIYMQAIDGGFIALSQNAPIGSRTALVKFNGNNVIGLLRPKVAEDIPVEEIGKLYKIVHQSNVNIDKLYQIVDANNRKFDQILAALQQQDQDFSKEVQHLLGEIRNRPTQEQLDSYFAKTRASVNIQAPPTSQPELPKVSVLTKLIAAITKPKA